jgi:S1-C subfamily serine protease
MKPYPIQIYFFCLMFLAISCKSQSQLSDISPTGIIGAETTANNYVGDTVAMLATTNGPRGKMMLLGSGFLVRGRATTHAILGITCNHIIKWAAGSTNALYFGLDTTNGWGSAPLRVLYLDVPNDVAVFTVETPGIVGGIADGDSIGLKNHYITRAIFDDGSALVLGRSLLIFGYPLHLGIDVRGNDHPIVSFGMVAQNGEPNKFLIDGMSNRGNSGSPVFSLGSTGKFLGMTTSVVNALIIRDSTNQLSADLPYNSGLTYAVKASVILHDIDEADKNY